MAARWATSRIAARRRLRSRSPATFHLRRLRRVVQGGKPHQDRSRQPPTGRIFGCTSTRTNDITARTFSQGNGYTPPGYDASAIPGPPTTSSGRAPSTTSPAPSAFSPAAPTPSPSAGMGDIGNAAATNQTVFLGEVRVTSVDRIFGDGMPGGGEATGQPIGQNIRRVMNVEASWAKAFGLEQTLLRKRLVAGRRRWRLLAPASRQVRRRRAPRVSRAGSWTTSTVPARR